MRPPVTFEAQAVELAFAHASMPVRFERNRDLNEAAVAADAFACSSVEQS